MFRERELYDDAGKRIKRELEVVDAYIVNNNSNNNNLLMRMGQMGRRQIMIPSATGGSLNTITPCAACKLLRRRCAEECPFSPYFSPHEPHKFAAVHKIFGASNVSKLLMEVPESQRADAANSLVYEANVRLRDPIYGCMGAISTLQQQIQSLQSDLNSVRSEILRYKYREATNNNNNNNTHHHHHDINNINNINNIIIASTLASNNSDPIGNGAHLSSAIQAPPTPPPPQPPQPSSVVISSSSASSSSSSSSSSSVCLYGIPSSTSSGYSTSTTIGNNNNVSSYFA